MDPLPAPATALLQALRYRAQVIAHDIEGAALRLQADASEATRAEVIVLLTGYRDMVRNLIPEALSAAPAGEADAPPVTEKGLQPVEATRIHPQ